MYALTECLHLDILAESEISAALLYTLTLVYDYGGKGNINEFSNCLHLLDLQYSPPEGI